MAVTVIKKLKSDIDIKPIYDELFNMTDIDTEMVKQKIGVDRKVLKITWDKEINKVFKIKFKIT